MPKDVLGNEAVFSVFVMYDGVIQNDKKDILGSGTRTQCLRFMKKHWDRYTNGKQELALVDNSTGSFSSFVLPESVREDTTTANIAVYPTNTQTIRAQPLSPSQMVCPHCKKQKKFTPSGWKCGCTRESFDMNSIHKTEKAMNNRGLALALVESPVPKHSPQFNVGSTVRLTNPYYYTSEDTSIVGPVGITGTVQKSVYHRWGYSYIVAFDPPTKSHGSVVEVPGDCLEHTSSYWNRVLDKFSHSRGD